MRNEKRKPFLQINLQEPVKDKTSYFSYNLELSRSLTVKSVNDLQHYQLKGLHNRKSHAVISTSHAIITRIIYD